MSESKVTSGGPYLTFGCGSIVAFIFVVWFILSGWAGKFAEAGYMLLTEVCR